MQDIIKGGDLAWVIKRQVLKVTTVNRKSPPEIDLFSIIRVPKTLPPNPGLANLITVVSNKLLKKKTSTLFLMMLPMAAAFQQTIQHFSALGLVSKMMVLFFSNGVQPVENMTKDQLLCMGLWTDGNKKRVCMTVIGHGIMAGSIAR
jgi:hypothetical protein